MQLNPQEKKMMIFKDIKEINPKEFDLNEVI